MENRFQTRYRSFGFSLRFAGKSFRVGGTESGAEAVLNGTTYHEGDRVNNREGHQTVLRIGPIRLSVNRTGYTSDSAFGVQGPDASLNVVSSNEGIVVSGSGTELTVRPPSKSRERIIIQM